MKEFIRLPPMSPPVQPLISPEAHPQEPGIIAIVEQAHQRAAIEQQNIPKDLLSNDTEDLIDLSNEFQFLRTQRPATDMNGSKGLDGLDGLLTPQVTFSDSADQIESKIANKHAVIDSIYERKDLQSPHLTSQSQIPSLSTPNFNAHCKLLKPESSESPQTVSQFPVPNPDMANFDAHSIMDGQISDTSPPTPAAPSIFSHASTLSSTSGFSLRSISQAELQEHDSKSKPLLSQSSYFGTPSQSVRTMAVRRHTLESLEQNSLISPHMTLSPVSSPDVHESTEFAFSALSGVSIWDKATLIPPGFSPESKSEDVTYQLNSTAEPILQGIDDPDSEGFPWIVQAGRDGDETQIKRLIMSGANIEAVHATTRRNALCEASLHGHSNVVDLLIHEGCRTDYVDAASYTALHHACKRGYLAIAKSLITANANIEAMGPQGMTSLHLAAQVPHRNVVMLLLQRHANVNARDENNQTPLHISSAQGNAEMCIYLLESGAQLDNGDSSSRTALQLACEANHYDTVKAMLKRSNLKTTELTFLSAFFAAVEHGHVRVAESFLSQGLDLQKLGKNDFYKPVTLAAKSGSPAMLELMIREKCNIKAKDDNDWNALHFACQHGHWKMIEPLVANDVSVKAATRTKDTPLILAVKGGHFAATEILLRSKGISVTVEDGQAQQPIHHATRGGLSEIFELLISNGAKIAVQNAFGWHPIHIAVAYGHTTLVNRLIEQSAKIEEKLGPSDVKKDQTHRMVKDGYWAEARWPYLGSRPLHLACEYGHYDIASNLISKDAKLEASCSEGWRPLHHAAFNGSSALVQLLLNVNCYPWAETEEGYTPQTLQFRTAGFPIPEEEKDKVRLLLQAAMDRTTKQPGVKGFKVGLKKCRTVEEKNNLIRAATSSMEMASKLPKQSTQAYRPQYMPHPMMHAYTAPSALQSIHHLAQTAQPSPSPLVERRVSSASNHPSITTIESSIETATQVASPAISLSNLASTESSGAKLEGTPINTAIASRPAMTVALQNSVGPMPGLPEGLPSVPLNLMKNRFKLKRASTFGVDMSKQGIEKMSSGLGASKQGLEKVSSYSLDVSKQGIGKVSSGLGASKQGLEKVSSYSMDVSKQGYKKMSSYSQNMSKQGLQKMKKINYGQHMSKQGMEKIKKIGVGKDKKVIKQDTEDYHGDKSSALQLYEKSTVPGLKNSGGLPSSSPNAGEQRDATGDTASLDAHSDEDLAYCSDGADSVGAFSMGGFDVYADGGTDGGNRGDANLS